MGKKFLTSITALVASLTSMAISQTPLTMTSGRIAISHDGSNWDKDDIFALAMEWPIFASFGMQKALVHLEHSVIKCTDEAYYGPMKKSAEGWKKFPGIDGSVVFDAWINIDATVANFKKAGDASSAENPLYFLLAGPMEVPFRGIEAVAQDKRKFITLISHSRANETMGSCMGSAKSRLWADLKTTFQKDGVKFVEIPDQNANFGGIGHTKWSWMATMPDNPILPAASLKWVYEEQDGKGNGDISDGGMLWYALTGKTNGKMDDVKLRFQNPLPMRGGPTKVEAKANGSFLSNKVTLKISADRKVLNIMADETKDGGSISLYNIRSEKLGETTLHSGYGTLALDRIPLGKYFVDIKSMGQRVTKEILIN